MDSLRIEAIMREFNCNRWFRGCFPADRIPNVTTYPSSIIVNEDPSAERGTHWVAIFISNSYHCYYFDSYGLPPNDNISNYLKSFKIVTKNFYMFQSLLSDACAHYCIFFICLMSIGYPFNVILKILSCQRNSDSYVKNFVSKCLF